MQVEVEFVHRDEYPGEAFLEPETLKLLRDVAARAEAGDLDYLRTVGRVFQAVA